MDLLRPGPDGVESAAGGGQEIQVLPDRSLFAVQSFTVGASGIYFVGPPDGDSHTFPLRLLRFADGKTVGVTRLDRQPWLEFSMSPDEKRLVFARLDSSINEVMPVEAVTGSQTPDKNSKRYLLLTPPLHKALPRPNAGHFVGDGEFGLPP